MEWSSEHVRRLRAAARMTQRELSQWLGVTVKQVKHLENQRRNPSGPSTRLLDILAEKLRFDGSSSQIQIVGAATKQIEAPAPAVSEFPVIKAPVSPPDEAFVWE
jgi:transcriptional regulator with XRE-family HTH domain